MSYVFNEILEGKSVTMPGEPLYSVIFSVELGPDGSEQLFVLMLEIS